MNNQIPKIKFPGTPTYVELDLELEFVELFEKLEPHYKNCFLFESLGEQHYVSRYSVIGFNPSKIFSAKENTLTIQDTTNGEMEIYELENPYKALKQAFPQKNKSANYAGGLVGYLSYESVNYFENLNLKSHPDFGEFKLGLYEDGLILDKLTDEVNYFFYKENRLEKIKRIVNQKEAKKETPIVTPLGNNITKQEHVKIVNTVKEEIINGNTFQCQVGLKTKYKIEGNKLDIYKEYRKINPSPHMYFLKFSELCIIGASPELLVKLENKTLETFPLAATTKRGVTEEEDKALARGLLKDKKELAEHSMLIDLHRNDLGKISKFGSVQVRKRFDIKKFSHVQHISSEIVSQIRDDKDMFDAVSCILPAGTLSGTPKIETIKIIERNETEPRGPYGGAVGSFGFNGNCTLAIPIRTLFISGENAYAQTSGGVVYDSNPHHEYIEIERKLAATNKVLSEFMVNTK